jgi:hypothetical protein
VELEAGTCAADQSREDGIKDEQRSSLLRHGVVRWSVVIERQTLVCLDFGASTNSKHHDGMTYTLLAVHLKQRFRLETFLSSLLCLYLFFFRISQHPSLQRHHYPLL